MCIKLCCCSLLLFDWIVHEHCIYTHKKRRKKNLPALQYCSNFCYTKPTTFFFGLSKFPDNLCCNFVFFSVTKERTEIIFMGTHSDNPNDPNAEWFEYEFKCKPGSVTRRPCLISPYHYRLDWLMWFAAFQVSALNKLITYFAQMSVVK